MASLKTSAEIGAMAEAGRRLAEVLSLLAAEVRPGVATMHFEELGRKLIRERGAEPAFLGYRPHWSERSYPYALCVSLNDTVVHGRPGAYVIREGDLVKLDLGVKYGGWYVDAACTVGAGRITPEAQKLITATKTALERAIEETRPGRTLGDIGWAIEQVARRAGFSVARSLTGHGIGRELHEEPSVLNVGRRGKGEELTPGMVLAIEPMIVAGQGEVKERKDESVATADGSLAAHFEHTVAITKQGPRILTAP
ncbi:MAG: type I methionyl aminopeptidase [Candidatus Liptonbacteria bacterium RIFCSPLOWO2_01_FULL_56_20]|uniref:Methionine aminopeptidase n=1 Tax=Candidatus Liptonbacteria bacterium RIFCSPLOWO2_01_FULL_56_20 TaxID=1798652 RepID=A0A1G2CKS2_9BACT|nr:MAG: type I methionyl aminopeptidase [Candidatus Liptonbacteria bacterium RIFCSPHIGHO2_01_FULL_56_18b]OGZ01251.1 MAG: type I methionyl aminopeptidase [Candidatus Liptonbacteria bacterium RIFCSPLOWO2_01_FULL_56_20]